MKNILILLTTILLFSCTTTRNTNYTYDEVYDSYNTQEVISSEEVIDEPVNVYFNIVEYDLWTYRYPNYRRNWFYNNYFNSNYWSIYSPNYYSYNWYWNYYQPSYWYLGYNNYWYSYYGPYNNFWYYNNYYSNSFYYNNYFNNHHFNNNHAIHHRPVTHGPRKPFKSANKEESPKPKPIPTELHRQNPPLHSKPDYQPVRNEPVKPRPNFNNNSQNKPDRVNNNRPVNKPTQNIQRGGTNPHTQPQKNIKPRR